MYSDKNIWLVLDSRTIGGIETHVLELARGLRNQGLQVSVVFLEHYGHHPLRAALQNSGINTLTLDGGLWSLLNSIRDSRPGLLHSHGYKAGIFCSIAASITHTTHVSTFHAGDPGKGKVALFDWLHRQAARFVDVNMAVSKEIAARVPATTEVINNFVSIPELLPKSGSQLAFVGRLSEEKGADRLLEIASKLPGVGFDFYGDGPLGNSLRDSASANCRFHGNQPDMSEHWPQIDLLLMPSRHEGLPMAALEAMARGIPVIAFDVGALDQLIESGKSGWLIPPGNISAFQNAIEHWLVKDEAQKDLMRRAARDRVAGEFSTRKIVPILLEYYRRASGNRFPVCDAFCE